MLSSAMPSAAVSAEDWPSARGGLAKCARQSAWARIPLSGRVGQLRGSGRRGVRRKMRGTWRQKLGRWEEQDRPEEGYSSEDPACQ